MVLMFLFGFCLYVVVVIFGFVNANIPETCVLRES